MEKQILLVGTADLQAVFDAARKIVSLGSGAVAIEYDSLEDFLKDYTPTTTHDTQYAIKGIVLGNYWGGGAGLYPASQFGGEDRDKIIEQAKRMLADGSLDSGMGYESLTGALLELETCERVTVHNEGNFGAKVFTNIEHEILFIGELTDQDKEQLLDHYYLTQ